MRSHLQWEILKHFSTQKRLSFALKEVVKEFPEWNPAYLARILTAMVDKGILCRITRDIYYIVPLNMDPETYIPDCFQVAKYLVKRREYYIGYSSAMIIHGLSSKSEPKVYMVTRAQMKPALRSFRGISVQFILHSRNRFFGYRLMWVSQVEKAMVSELEKTIVDITTKPGICGGIIEVGKAIYKAKARTDHEKLFYYFARNRNNSAKKRYLYITELLGLEWTAEHERMMKELGTGITLLDPSEQDRGIRSYRFGLRINVDPVRIKNSILQ